MQPDPIERPPLDLDAIRARHHKAMMTIADIIRYGYSASVADAAMRAVSQSAADVPALEDEVTALRAELDAARAYARKASDAIAEHLDAARAGRTEPATGEDVNWYGAMKDDLEKAYQALQASDYSDLIPLEYIAPVIGLIAAALDLPGRVRALREEIERLTYERRLLGTSRMVLDLVAEGHNHGYDEAYVRREAANMAQRIVDEIGHPVTDEPALGPNMREEIASLNAALADVAQKLDEAREDRREAVAE